MDDLRLRRCPATEMMLLCAVAASLFFCGVLAGETFVYYDWEVSYLTVSPLGVPQTVIAVNGSFPGPLMNITTNWNVVVNVLNSLDEPLLLTWRNSWQDGVLGTNCPIPPGWNWTYEFQAKDQIGSFFYFPSLFLQRTSGGFGGITVNNREVIPVPFGKPDGEFEVFIGDWYIKNHTELRKMLDEGKELGVPDGILINGKGPYRYNTTLVPDNIKYETLNVQPGKVYRIRVHNVGTSTSLNFRVQNHSLLLIETEGTYTTQQNMSDIDIHVGQSYSFLLSANQDASNDYYIVASPRFVNESTDQKWSTVNGVAILKYDGSKGVLSDKLPDGPNDLYYKEYSINQAKSIKMNTSAGAARPNPQGSFKYGTINITKTYIIKSKNNVLINGKKRATLNGISYKPPETPLRQADLFNLSRVYTMDFPSRPMDRKAEKIGASVINETYKGFIEIVLVNNDTGVQNFHLDGYSFFVVGMEYGEWTENSRNSYDKWSAVSRTTTQVFSGAWTAVLVSLDNVGIWNLRSENLDRWYLGQETYLRVSDPDGYNKTEMIMPSNALFCGLLKSKQKDQVHVKSGASYIRIGRVGLIVVLFLVGFIIIA
ncbi:hypothetical protein LUZ60_011676 [Juncus effusus]|nr:hypothetical protein LUZ60_011676 [Juncus effusus]